jgi:MFS family permease
VLPWVVPPFATGSLHIGARAIGLLLLANAAAVVVAQVPVARVAEGRRRAVMMVIGALLIAAALLLTAFAGSVPGGAYAALLVASVGIGVGECFHTAALMPLVADLAPRHLRGRYMATVGFSWWIGLALAPIVGTRLLGVSATLTFASSAAVACAAALSLVALERRLPQASRWTPRYVGSATSAVSSPSRTSAATASSSSGA